MWLHARYAHAHMPQPTHVGMHAPRTQTHTHTHTHTCTHKHTHTHQGFGVSMFAACLLSHLDAEEHGKERQRAVKSISPHCGSGWQGSASTHWGPVRCAHTHTHTRTHPPTHATEGSGWTWTEVQLSVESVHEPMLVVGLIAQPAL